MYQVNTTNPIVTVSKKSKLKDGTEVTVTGQAFEQSIWPIGEAMFSMVKISDEKRSWPIFFREQLSEKELNEKIKVVCKNPDRWTK